MTLVASDMLLENMPKIINKNVLSESDKKLNEAVGHTLPEIIIGVCLGIIITLTVYKSFTF